MNSSSVTPGPVSGHITLDSHTTPFFSEEFHIGPIEKFFHLGCPSVRERVFAGKYARMHTGELVVVLQQQKTARSGPTVDEGAVFVGDATLLHDFQSFPAAPYVFEFWKRELFQGAHSSHALRRAHALTSRAKRRHPQR